MHPLQQHYSSAENLSKGSGLHPVMPVLAANAELFFDRQKIIFGVASSDLQVVDFFDENFCLRNQQSIETRINTAFAACQGGVFHTLIHK